MSRHPLVKWAQRSDKIFLTVELPDAKDVKLDLDPEGKFFFSATSGANGTQYVIDIDLYDKVDVKESKASFTSRNICYLIKKAESKWWTRLLKQEGKQPEFLKVDWDKWVDEDEQEGKDAAMDYGDFDFSKLDVGGAGDSEGEDDESDTEEEDVGTVDKENKQEEVGTAVGGPEAEPAASTEPTAAKA